MSPTALTAQLKASTQEDRAAARRISDVAKAKAAEESRAPKAGNQVRVVAAPQTTGREVHKDRIGMVMSTPSQNINSYYAYSVKFADESLVSFYAKELEICPSPTAL